MRGYNSFSPFVVLRSFYSPWRLLIPLAYQIGGAMMIIIIGLDRRPGTRHYSSVVQVFFYWKDVRWHYCAYQRLKIQFVVGSLFDAFIWVYGEYIYEWIELTWQKCIWKCCCLCGRLLCYRSRTGCPPTGKHYITFIHKHPLTVRIDGIASRLASLSSKRENFSGTIVILPIPLQPE